MNDEEILAAAAAARNEFSRRRRTVMDFRYDEKQDKYWDLTTGELLTVQAVNGAIAKDDWPQKWDEKKGQHVPTKPAAAINDIDTGLTVEGSTWWPGRPQIIENTVVGERGPRRVKGAQTYNSYFEPDRRTVMGEPTIWIEHIRNLYPCPVEHEHFFDFFAHVIQRPGEKVNHGIVLAGAQGIGKDTALAPIRYGIGEWNAAEIGPDDITSAYNGYCKSVLLVINEVRPQDDSHKASNFYNLLKPLLSAPPDVLGMTVKYQNTIYIPNVCHVVLTTNDPLSMYIPAEDRRLFVMTSPISRGGADGPPLSVEYFNRIHTFLQGDGAAQVVSWLAARDLSGFNRTAPPPSTSGKELIICSAADIRRNAADEVIEAYLLSKEDEGRPDVLFRDDLLTFVNESELFDGRDDAVKALKLNTLHFRLDGWEYDGVKNPNGREWKCGKFRTRKAFVHRTVPQGERFAAVTKAMEAWAARIG